MRECSVQTTEHVICEQSHEFLSNTARYRLSFAVMMADRFCGALETKTLRTYYIVDRWFHPA